MEWTVQIGTKSQNIKLPDAIPDNMAFDISVNGKAMLGKWQRATRTLFLMDPKNPDVWMPLHTRTKTISRFPGESDINANIEFTPAGARHPLCCDATVALYVPGQEGRDSSTQKKPKVIRSQITGKVLKILTKVGDSVTAGDTLMIVEAMKMENRILAVSNGVIEAIKVAEGETISSGKELIKLK